mmetsp:Transcript_34483/g.60570  ORF Transcript_34483/g.60570 Transcript_34483/m.60570 type:complete len:212 (-) Transcript_34483:1316-1951(-)
MKSSPAWSLYGRHSSKDREYVPGPGTYDPRVTDGSPRYRVGTSKRSGLVTTVTTPGPGTYTTEKGWITTSPVRFGTDKRRPLSPLSTVPGPGTYTTFGKSLEGPAFTMRSRTAKIRRAEVPGPGTYQQNINDFVYESSPKSKFGTSNRGSTDMSKNPVGPGLYDVRGKFEGPQWGFGSSNRSELRTRSENPGPGTYNVKPTVPDLPYYAKT